MAPTDRQPKAMSSRLATMKFMQRAGASPSSSPSTPSEPPSKKQRLSNGSFKSTPSSTPRRDSDGVGDAQSTGGEALERETANGAEKWYLSLQEPRVPAAQSPLRIVSAGYSMLDATAKGKVQEDDEEEEGRMARPSIAGRRSFGKFNKVVEKQQNPDADSDSDSASSDSEDEDDEDESDDPTGAKAMIAQARKEAGDKARAERKAKKLAEKAEASRFAEERRGKQVNLNKLTSISGGGNAGGPPSRTQITCHGCGKKGHIARECPQNKQPKPQTEQRKLKQY